MLNSSQLSSLALLAFAACSFPFVLTYAVCIKLFRLLLHTRAWEDPRAQESDSIRKTVIVTGGKMTKALCVARQLKKAGCRVVMVETHKYWMVASRFASCVDRFVTVPVPEEDPKAYLQALKVLAHEEDADLFVPVSSPVASVYDARVEHVLPGSCRSLAAGEIWTAALDDKVTFSELAKNAGLPGPDTRRVTSKEAAHAFNNELRLQGDAAKTYVLKNLAYDSMRRLDLFKLPCPPAALAAYIEDIEISTASPWVCQEFVKGQEYSTCAIAHQGSLTLFTDNKASISCFNYQQAGERKLREWVETFVATYKLSGILCIDFFIGADGTPMAIECNPRFSSNIANFYDSPTAARAYLEPDACARDGVVERPTPNHAETCWIACELYYALTKPGYSVAERARNVYDALFVKKDAYYDPDDLLPFLALYFVHMPVLLWRNVRRGNQWAKIDLCIGKLTEVNGD
jgi:predicted ATP-grasp superfamily ATP-dependent carboligase